jgi:hypothetical protein
VTRTEIGGDAEQVGGCCASTEAAEIGLLDRGAVGHRIGEGHAEFDDISSSGDKGVEDRVSRAIAAGHEGDKGRVGFGEGGGEAGHIALSPSGERVGRGGV